MPIAFITGATSGIGRATADTLADLGYDLIVHGRRADRLVEVVTALSPRVRVHPLAFDVRDRPAVLAAIAALPADFQAIDVLVNNAGNAHGLEPLQDGDPDDWDAMLDANVKGLLSVTKAVLPGMVARRRGHVVNLGSIAGLAAYPGGNVYCATKAAVAMLTDGMRLDLNPYGIKITAIHPGAVETEFSLVRFKGDTDRAQKPYAGIAPLVAADIADVIGFVVSRPAHVVLADVVIYPTAQASATVMHRQ